MGNEADLPYTCYESKQLMFLGPGIPLYFHFIKQACYLLLLLLAIFGVFATISNYLVTLKLCRDIDAKKLI